MSPPGIILDIVLQNFSNWLSELFEVKESSGSRKTKEK
jgi:hypothetical protein